MPNIWTHIIWGQEVLERVGKQDLLQHEELLRVFNCGCQGPDFLFYHHFLPWQRDKKMNKLGTAMHERQCGPMLLDMIASVQGRDANDPAVVYVLGFLMHHILDRNMHPYIFYRSGPRKWDHQHFEVAMDSLIARKKLGLETWRTPVWKQIFIGAELPEGVVSMFMQATSRLYPELTRDIRASDWTQAYRDMIRAQKLFHDPSGLKRVATLGQMAPMVYKRHITPHDFLNEAGSEWRHPAIDDRCSTQSIWDMWALALEDGVAVMRAALAAIAAKSAIVEESAIAEVSAIVEEPEISAIVSTHAQAVPVPALQAAIGNKSYETGEDCDKGLTIRFSDPEFW